MKRGSEPIDFDRTEKRNKYLNNNYFLPINTGLVYDHIVNYRVIENEDNTPKLYTFLSIEEAETYIKEKKLDNAIIRALVYQNGFYLLNKEGTFIDKKTNLCYSFVDKKRYSEWDLYYLKQEILLHTIHIYKIR